MTKFRVDCKTCGFGKMFARRKMFALEKCSHAETINSLDGRLLQAVADGLSVTNRSLMDWMAGWYKYICKYYCKYKYKYKCDQTLTQIIQILLQVQLGGLSIRNRSLMDDLLVFC